MSDSDWKVVAPRATKGPTQNARPLLGSAVAPTAGRRGRKPNVQGQRTKLTAQVGRGTLEDPYIYWTFDYETIGQKRFDQCCKIAQHQARKLKCKAVVVRRENHSTQNARDPMTGLLTGEQEAADNHITLYVGNALKDIRWGAHAYVVTDENGVPIRPMTAEERKIVGVKEKPCSEEYWAVKAQPYANINPTLQGNMPFCVLLRDGTTPNGFYIRTSDQEKMLAQQAKLGADPSRAMASIAE